MATIDYKQKIKDYMNSSEVDTLYKSMLNNLFPELAESEDEKIRNSIIHLVEKSHEYGGYALHKDEAEKMLAWLENVGEQKPADVRTTGYWHVEDVEQNNAWSEEDERIYKEQ